MSGLTVMGSGSYRVSGKYTATRRGSVHKTHPWDLPTNWWIFLLFQPMQFDSLTWMEMQPQRC